MRRLYTYYIYMMLAALGLPGCDLIHDDDMDCQLYTPEGVPYAYVSIALSTAMTPSTRANPTGGEDGDGEEPGQANENEVNDITLFFYCSYIICYVIVTVRRIRNGKCLFTTPRQEPYILKD